MTGESKREKDIWSDGEFGQEKDNSGKCLCDIRNNKLRYENSDPPRCLERVHLIFMEVAWLGEFKAVHL